MDVRPKIERDEEPEEDPRQGFPKYLVRDLVAQNLDSEERRLRVQMGFFGLSLALLALAIPTERLLGEGMRRIDRWVGGHASWADPWAGILRAFDALPGVSPERGGFLAAALGWGACFLGLVRLGGRLGLQRGLALSMGLLVCAAPAILLIGTLPGPESWVAAISTALFATLLGPSDRPGKPSSAPALLLGLLLIALDWRAIVLLPAWTLALGEAQARVLAPFRPPAADENEGAPIRIQRGPSPTAILGFVALEALAVVGVMLTITRAPDEITREFGTASIPLGGAALSALAGGGALVLGLLALALAPGDEGESRPPLWIGIWASGGAFLLLTPSDQLLGWALLAPAALAGVAHGFARLEGRTPVKLGIALLLSQLGLAVWAGDRIRTTDPLADWRATATRRLEPTDFVVTDSAARHYLLRKRWAVEAELWPVDAPESIEDAITGKIEDAFGLGHRVVLDGPSQAEVQGLLGTRLPTLGELPDPKP